MMNCTATRKLRLKDIHNNSYNTDEILELLKDFEGTDNYAGALSFVCLLLGTAPEKSGRCLNMWSDWSRQKTMLSIHIPVRSKKRHPGQLPLGIFFTSLKCLLPNPCILRPYYKEGRREYSAFRAKK